MTFNNLKSGQEIPIILFKKFSEYISKNSSNEQKWVTDPYLMPTIFPNIDQDMFSLLFKWFYGQSVCNIIENESFLPFGNYYTSGNPLDLEKSRETKKKEVTDIAYYLFEFGNLKSLKERKTCVQRLNKFKKEIEEYKLEGKNKEELKRKEARKGYLIEMIDSLIKKLTTEVK